MNNNTCVLSICMITYNHESFIEEAIEGVLMQKASFNYQLIIGEDYSTDNTRVICEEYAQKYPEKITLLPSEKNWGMMPNFVRTFNACEGKYIALCEGDDYWIDPLKLQKQIDYLEHNNNINVSVHNTIRITDDKEIVFSTRKEKLIQFPEWCSSPNRLAHTASFVYRNNKTLPETFHSLINGDFFIATYMERRSTYDT